MIVPHIPKKFQLVIACAVLFALLQLWMPQFIYQRDVMTSEPWRWWTAQWVHVGWRHYLLNMMALTCLPFIFPQSGRFKLLSALLVLSPMVSLGLYWFFPTVYAYAGLSGVLHGLYTWAALMVLFPSHASFSHTWFHNVSVRHQQTNGHPMNIQSQSSMQHLSRDVVPEKKFALFLLLAVIVKVLVEKKIGHTDTERLIGAHVLIQAHQIGLVVGIIYFSLLYGWYKLNAAKFSDKLSAQSKEY